MEHRNGKRLRRALPIELWRGGCCLGVYQSDDVGAGGLSLIGEGKPIHEGDLLRVKTCGTIAFNRNFERKAMVIYRRQQRLGLMWADVDSDFIDVLEHVKYNAA